MTKLVHGGDIYTAMENGIKQEDILDYSANINPLGMPEGVKTAVAGALDKCDHYPDPLCRKLSEAVAEKEGISKDYLIFGNGAADLIFRLVMAKSPAKAMVLAPTFAEYETALSLVKCEISRYQLKEKEGFALTEDFISCITDELDMIFLCNPNNPTGRQIDQDLLERIINVCKAKDVLLVVDECFIDFLEKPDKVTVRGHIADNPNLFILRAFTKNYAMPGLRLGYGICSDSGLMEAIADTGQPWSVSLVAQEAGLQALKEEEYLESARQLIFAERENLVKGLEKLGYTVFKPAANYIFFKLKQAEDTEYVDSFIEDMSREGILIRSCENYHGLAKGFFRIAVRKKEENLILLDKLNRRELAWQKQ